MKVIFTGALLLELLSMSAPGVSQTREAVTTSTGAAGGQMENLQPPALTGVRHPLYRLKKSDVVEIHFTFTPEYDQTARVQPDGLIALKDGASLLAEGRSLPELKQAIAGAYSFMRDPEISIALKDFELPFFIVGGQVGHPGKYQLRSPTTVTEAIAISGGFNEQSKHSQVVLFRKVNEGVVEARVLNLKAMLGSRHLEEDVDLRPGDMLYIPQNRISKIKKYLPVASLSTFFSPAQF